MANKNLKSIKFPGLPDTYDVCKYDDLLNVIKITNPNTTMGDIVTILNAVNAVGNHVVFDVAALDAGMYLCTIYIGSGYYRIADLVTGFEGTGFFVATDKLADIIESGSQSSGKHYTMQWDMINAQGVRLNDAASITTDTSNFGHFGRTYTLGNYRYFDITDENLQDNIAYAPSLVGRWLGVDVTLTLDGSSKHCNLPKTGMPMANIAGSTMHTYAKNYGASLNDIYSIDAVSMLYIVEYANMNLQTKLGSGVSDLYKQAMHPAAAVTAEAELTIATTYAGFIAGAIVDIGTTDGSANVARTSIVSAVEDNGSTTLTLADAVTCTTEHFVSIHGLINVADSDIGSKSGYIGTNGKSNAYYRGQTFYANKFQYILGAYRQKDTTKIWIAEEGDTDNYDALDTTKHKDTGLTVASASGYIQTLGIAEGLSFAPFCTATGGSSSNPVGDYCWVPAADAANTVLWLGGYAHYGVNCGWYGSWSSPASPSYWYFGSCPRLLNP